MSSGLAEPTSRFALDDKALSDLLATWKSWCQRDDTHLGYPSRAAGIRWSPGQDFDEMCDSLDNRLAMAVDAVVDSLPPNEKAVVRAYVLDAGRHVWRFREPVEVIYARAREMLKIGLNRRGVE